MNYILALFCLCFVAAVSCQTPPPHATCAIPGNWSATISQTLLFDAKKAYELNYGQIYYSQPTKSVRVDILAGKTNYGGSVQTYSDSVWQDFNSKVEYILDRSTNECIKLPLPFPMAPGNLPADARFGGTVLLGSQPVHEYWFPLHMNGQTFHVEVGLMAGSCLMFNTEIFNATAAGEPQKMLIDQVLYNNIATVPPFVMDIPSQCLNAQLSSRAVLSDRLDAFLTGLHLRFAAF